MEQGLDEILSNTPAEPASEPTTTEAPPVTDERPRGPDGKFIAKDTGDPPQAEAPAAEAAPPAAEPDTIPRTALMDERRKRQELERRLAHYEAQLQARQQPQHEPQPVDFWDDPNSFLETRLQQFGQSLIQQWTQQQHVERANQSEAAARAKYPDYDEVIGEFHAAAQQNPRLAQEMFAAPDPAEFAYRRGKQTRELAEAGDLEAYKAKVIEDYKRTLLSDVRPTAPTTTADTRSVSGRGAPEWSGPAPLGDLLK